VDVHTRQPVVTKFLTAEGSNLIETHRRLRSMYDEYTIVVSSVRCWVHCFTSSEKDTGCRICSGQPALAVMMETNTRLMH
jgi:hypothetical protein